MRSRVRQRRAENNTRHVREFQQDFNAFSWFKNYLQSGCFEIFYWYRSILLFFSGWNIISSLSGVRKSNPHRDLAHTHTSREEQKFARVKQPARVWPPMLHCDYYEWVWVNYNYQHWSVSAINDEPWCPHNVTSSMSRREFLPSDVLRPGSGSNVIQIGFHIIIINVHPL